jgi:hypothetical protein
LCGQCRQGKSWGSIATGGLEQGVPQRNPRLAKLLGGQEAVILAGHEQWRSDGDVSAAYLRKSRGRLLEEAVVPSETQELLGKPRA